MPPVPAIESDDLLSRYGAGLLADAINAWWHSRGHRTVLAERYLMEGTKGAWGVTSNLVNGLPPAQQGKTLAERRAEFLG